MSRYKIRLIPSGAIPQDVNIGVHLARASEGGAAASACVVHFGGLIITPTTDSPNAGDITYQFTWDPSTDFCDKCVEVGALVQTLSPPDPSTDITYSINCNDRKAQFVDVVVPAAALAVSDWYWSILFVVGFANFGEYTQTYCNSSNNFNTLGSGDPFTAGFGPGLWPVEFEVNGIVCTPGGFYDTGMDFEVLVNGATPVPFFIPLAPTIAPPSYQWQMNLDVSATSPGDVITIQPRLSVDTSDFGSPMTLTGV